jgi:DNA polymerase III subunit delta'
MNLPWQEDMKEHLSEAMDQGRLGHAPILTGPEGVGKSALTTWLVHRLLCLEPEGAKPCGRCRACELLASATHPDFFQVGIPEDKKEIPVDSIRELSAKLHLTPRVGPRRVGLVSPAEAMNLNASNALLKTLEEPSDNAWVILLTHRPGRLPATIRSRCQPVPVRPPETGQALAWLGQQCPGQRPEILNEALALAAGAPLAARALLEDDGLDFGHEVLGAMVELARGQPVAKVLSDRWLNTPLSTWRWLALWTSVMMHHAQGMSHERIPEHLEMPDGLDPRALAGLWEQALAGNALTSTNVRQDLLINKWLLEWQTLAQPGN